MSDAPNRIWIKTDDPNNRPFVTRGPLAAPPYTEYVRANLAKPKVKPLVWHKSHFNTWAGDWHTVPTGYTVRCADENGWKWQGNAAFGYAPSDEAAKAAAQADYERRILEALENTYE